MFTFSRCFLPYVALAGVSAAPISREAHMRRESLSQHDRNENVVAVAHHSLSVSSDGQSAFDASRHIFDPRQSVASGRDKQRKCGEAMYAPGSACPEDCPFKAEENATDRACFFRCVKAHECGGTNLRTQEDIADATTKMCRRCKTVGCKKCKLASEDCDTCLPGYEPTAVGGCQSPWRHAANTFKYGLLTFLILLLIWFVDLNVRPQVNAEGLAHGSWYRAMTIVAQEPEFPDTTRHLWPMGTNLCSDTRPGGLGLCLHMRFQAYMIVWALVIAMVFLYLILMVDNELLSLGLKRYHTTADLCGVIQWGSTKTHEMKYVLLAFTAFAYLFSTLMAFFFSLTNTFTASQLDGEDVRMKEYAAQLSGLPAVKGSVLLEEEIQTFVEDLTMLPVVGASVGWDVAGHGQHLEIAFEEQTEEFEQMTDPEWQWPYKKQFSAAWAENGPVLLRPLTRKMDGWWRKWVWGMSLDDTMTTDEDHIKDILSQEILSSPYAIVVFESPNAKNKALEAFAKKARTKAGAVFRESQVKLEPMQVMPQQIRWEHYAVPGTRRGKAAGLIRGVFLLLLTLTIWTICVHMPATYFFAAQAYAAGAEPSMLSWTFFLLTVFMVVGNHFLYKVCEVATAGPGFELETTQLAVCNAFYTVALFVNGMCAVVCSGYAAYERMVLLETHTDDGRKLGDLKDLQQVVSTYPMQKALGFALFYYSFPMTYIMPQLFELAIVKFRYAVDELMVAGRPEFRGRRAERVMHCFLKMKMCRYSEMTCSMMMGCMSFFFAGGWVFRIFGLMAASFVLTYIIDVWRILRMTSDFHFGDNNVDYSAQVMLVFPTCIILCGLVYRLLELNEPGASQMVVLQYLGLAVLIHFTFYLGIVMGIVPRLARKSKGAGVQYSYSKFAKHHPENYFSLNHVHCLRSSLLYEHSPPCSYFEPGKEYLMWPNADIGIYYGLDVRPYPKALLDERRAKKKACEEEKAAEEAAEEAEFEQEVDAAVAAKGEPGSTN